MACMGRTSRSRRPCARGEVLCTEPGKSHPCPDRQAGPVHEGNSRTMNMHADENSDGVIVPEKRPNKEGLPSAEAVEGRTPPKGNGDETAAARTLRRDNASNGLIAVRQAARQSKSVRFTALLHHITVDLLKRSYLSLERDSAPGIDGVTSTYGSIAGGLTKASGDMIVIRYADDTIVGFQHEHEAGRSLTILRNE